MMKLLVYNYAASDISLHHEAQVLKTAYLFAETVVSAGTSPCLFFMQQLAREMKTTRQKVDFLKHVIRDYARPEYLTLVEDIEATVKRHQQIKHPNGKLIAAFRQFEIGFNKVYFDTIQEIDDRPHCLHYNRLFPLLEKGLFETIAADLEDPEGDTDIKQPLSRFLLGKTNEPEGLDDFFFFLTPDFFTTGPGAMLHTDTPQHPLFVAPLFSLPNLNSLSAQELKLLRGELKPAARPFQAAVKAWLALWNQPETDNNARITFFNEQVLPAAAALGVAIEGSRILKPYHHLPDKLEVLIGAMPLELIWNHLHHCKAIPDATWEVLKSEEKEGKAWEMFFCTRHHIPDVAPQNSFTQDHAATVTKRSLVID